MYLSLIDGKEIIWVLFWYLFSLKRYSTECIIDNPIEGLKLGPDCFE